MAAAAVTHCVTTGPFTALTGDLIEIKPLRPIPARLR